MPRFFSLAKLQIELKEKRKRKNACLNEAQPEKKIKKKKTQEKLQI